jgi:hypothetical protein
MTITLNGTTGVTTPGVTDTGALSVTGISTLGAMGSSVITSGTAQASTSGTSIDFTSIPSWVKRITMMLNGVSTNGTSVPMVQLGSGSITASGYTGTVTTIGTGSGTAAAVSIGNYLVAAWTAASVLNGSITIELLGSNIYVIKGVLAFTNSAANAISVSNVTLGGALDRVRITAFNGTDTFDAGSINIFYE